MSADKKVIYQSYRPTYKLTFQLYAKGMVARLGDHTCPSVALLDRHVRFLDSALAKTFLDAKNDFQRRKLSLAGLANLTLWLGWLQSSECFGLNWEDCSLVEPADHAVSTNNATMETLFSGHMTALLATPLKAAFGPFTATAAGAAPTSHAATYAAAPVSRLPPKPLSMNTAAGVYAAPTKMSPPPTTNGSPVSGSN
ncbi:unnamed protein product [Cylindrotheca closterium]|uniref:Uncharacterized protein n=1 Tax=Cylindrotheca closterium TaxID=2856 RepID=A0AAD2CPE4_9STRA|nr:unnamed protein product [Cylindrotheca closterium]